MRRDLARDLSRNTGVHRHSHLACRVQLPVIGDRPQHVAVMVGGGNGRLKGNRHIVAKDTPTSNLLLTLAHVGGAEIESLPASTGRVDL
jgi:hypothetical protein